MCSEPRDRRARGNGQLRLTEDEDWQRLLAWLPKDIDEAALACGAIVRRRVVASGTMLLRLLLAYVVCCLSLRDAAAWAARALGVHLTADALAYRFVHALPLMQGLVSRLLEQQILVRPTTTMRLRIVDATMLTEPGRTEPTWRLHLTYSPSPCRVVGVELTDGRAAEHLERGVFSAGDLVLGDRGLGHAADVRAVRARGADCLLRVNLRQVVLEDRHGRRRSPTGLLRDARRGRLDHTLALHEHGHEPVQVRVVLLPLPKEKAARARQRVRKTSKRKSGAAPRALTLRLAGYFCCITTLSAKQASVTALARWYGVRWQVELFFKRCKSLLHLDHLTNGRKALVEVQIWARLLTAVLVERMVARSATLGARAALPVSLWRLTHLHWIDVALAIYGGCSLQMRLAATLPMLEHLCERPRRRGSGVDALVNDIGAVLGAPRISRGVA